jgi:AcrR family transcriptional regulator
VDSYNLGHGSSFNYLTIIPYSKCDQEGKWIVYRSFDNGGAVSQTAETRRSVGRPRNFDIEQVLDKAVRLFWRHGYEATSMSDLVTELGVGAPSLYAAFGNKAQLFAAVVERYAATVSCTSYASVEDCELTTYEAIRELLMRTARLFSETETPAGCLIVSAAAAVSPASAAIEQLLRDKRLGLERGIAERLRRGVESGELADDLDPAAFAKFLNCVMQGMSVQARDGATLEDLQALAAMALDRWPAGAQRPATARTEVS